MVIEVFGKVSDEEKVRILVIIIAFRNQSIHRVYKVR